MLTFHVKRAVGALVQGIIPLPAAPRRLYKVQGNGCSGAVRVWRNGSAEWRAMVWSFVSQRQALSVHCDEFPREAHRQRVADQQ